MPVDTNKLGILGRLATGVVRPSAKGALEDSKSRFFQAAFV